MAKATVKSLTDDLYRYLSRSLKTAASQPFVVFAMG